MALRNVLRLGRYSRSLIALRNDTFVRPIFRYQENTSRLPVQHLAYSQQSEPAPRKKDEKKSHEFQAETQMLLDIVAKSLYSEKEVFVRELISNASDAVEKLRYISLAEGKSLPSALEIRLTTDKQNRILTIEDTGIGMTKEELISNLGTIARSGSKAFLEELKSKGSSEASSIIGQFGVGFYSCFMVANKVEVYTKSYKEGSVGYKWSSDGSGTYDIEEAENVQPGTKIVIHLKADCREYAEESSLKNVIQKYSNFIGQPVLVNGTQVNQTQALWLMDPKEVTEKQHEEFYKLISGSYDKPRFTLHYKTDSPLMIRSLLYFPDGKPGYFEMARENNLGVALYTRKVLIQSKAENILPKWLRFIKGVVDSEDIPLNLSRELLQNSALIAKLRRVLTARILKFLNEKMIKHPEEYEKFYLDYGIFIKEGIITAEDNLQRAEIASLLKFESSAFPPGVLVTLNDYISRIKDGKREIYYLAAPSREVAESSPYYESLKKQNVEVLFCTELHDEHVLVFLQEYKNCRLTSLEKEMSQGKEAEAADFDGQVLDGEIDSLKKLFKTTLKHKINAVKITKRLENHPCAITLDNMASARQFIKQMHTLPEENLYSILRPQLEINPTHPIIKKLSKLQTSNPELADLLAKQLFNNAMVAAGLIEDSRVILRDLNSLLTLALKDH